MTNDTSEKFTGQARDQETGMDFFNARYFGAALGGLRARIQATRERIRAIHRVGTDMGMWGTIRWRLWIRVERARLDQMGLHTTMNRVIAAEAAQP